MNEENKIDQYFDRVKKNPPLMNIEKVRQTLTEVKPEVKVEKGRPNLLKFTIMTTLFAIIIGAFMFCPSSKEKSQKTIIQNPTTPVLFADSMPTLGNKERRVKEYSSISIPDNELKKVREIEKEHQTEPVEQKNLPKPLEEKQDTEIDLDSIQTVDGNQFILKLSNEELEKIGFQITDTSIIFSNCIGRNSYFYTYKVNKYAGIVGGTSKAFLQSTESTIPCKKISKIKPLCQTNKFFSELRIVDHFGYEEFYSVNDTLIPIIIPISELNPEVIDDIIWFTANDELLEILSEKHKPFINNFLKYRMAKRALPQKDFIQYEPPKLIKESKIISLNLQQMRKIGFEIFTDSIIYNGKI